MVARRAFAGFVAGGLVASQIPVDAQQTGKVHRVAYLSTREAIDHVDEYFVRALRDLGYATGRNLVLEYHWAGNDPRRLQELTEEIVRKDVDVIVTDAGPAIRAAMRATRRIPIVMVAVQDPLAAGWVASLARPGGNVTGLSVLGTDLMRKRLQLLHEIVPGATRMAVLIGRSSGATSPVAADADFDAVRTELSSVGRQLGVDLALHSVGREDELRGAFAAIKRDGAGALLVLAHSLFYRHRATVAAIARADRLADLYEIREYMDGGGLVSYGPDVRDVYRRLASYVDRILRGAYPGDLALEQPTKLELVINLETAKAIGVAIPPALQLRADELIR